jgi:hypothetical protein
MTDSFVAEKINMDDLTDEERVALIAAVRKALADDPFPRAPRLEALPSALAKLDPTSVLS